MATVADSDQLNRLPLLSHADCALGTALKSYFDECINYGASTSEETKKAVKAKHAEDYFPYSKHLEKDMARAFALWEAVRIACTCCRHAAANIHRRFMLASRCLATL